MGSKEETYTLPDNYDNLDELEGPPPVENPDERHIYHHESLEEERDNDVNRQSKDRGDVGLERQQSQGSQSERRRRQSNTVRSNEEYTLPDNYDNLDELEGPLPVENPDECHVHHHQSLEDERDYDAGNRWKENDDLERHQTRGPQRKRRQREDEDGNIKTSATPQPADGDVSPQPSSTESAIGGIAKSKALPRHERASQFATKLYTISYLIFFSIIGTLARLGVQALTFYPGAPVQIGVLWANFGGTLFMGFLSEDRNLFREEWGNASHSDDHEKRQDEEHGVAQDKNPKSDIHPDEAKKQHATVKKTIPLYIGLATGFCGSFTSFSSFIRDAFLALSNSLPVPVSHTSSTPIDTLSTVPRNGGYSFMAILAVLILTICLCLSAFQFGAHLALALEPITPSIPFIFARKFVDRSMVIVAWGCWFGAIVMAIWPPDRPGGPSGRGSWAQETWRGQALFSLVLAPPGCLLRFYLSLYLNGRISAFPLGTFAANILGTVVQGTCYSLQHAPLSGGVIGGGMSGCQVLQGVMDGFCGTLTTVSTWIAELRGLRRRHAYTYGGASIGVATGFLVVIMGSLKWTHGFSDPLCIT
ncbi:hypothetical protein MMC12_006718 [Toensbergia leucococca]|nr:hypothetical protein [Toensbergia leucococca]